jgi:hypothetical protein
VSRSGLNILIAQTSEEAENILTERFCSSMGAAAGANRLQPVAWPCKDASIMVERPKSCFTRRRYALIQMRKHILQPRTGSVFTTAARAKFGAVGCFFAMT